MHVHYWWIQEFKNNGFYRNIKIEKLENISWWKAKQISYYHVALHHSNPTLAWVQSQRDESISYRVIQIKSNFSMCECPFSCQGYLCKHVIKVKMMRERLRKEIELEAGQDIFYTFFTIFILNMLVNYLCKFYIFLNWLFLFG